MGYLPRQHPATEALARSRRNPFAGLKVSCRHPRHHQRAQFGLDGVSKLGHVPSVTLLVVPKKDCRSQIIDLGQEIAAVDFNGRPLLARFEREEGIDGAQHIGGGQLALTSEQPDILHRDFDHVRPFRKSARLMTISFASAGSGSNGLNWTRYAASGS